MICNGSGLYQNRCMHRLWYHSVPESVHRLWYRFGDLHRKTDSGQTPFVFKTVVWACVTCFSSGKTVSKTKPRFSFFIRGGHNSTGFCVSSGQSFSNAYSNRGEIIGITFLFWFGLLNFEKFLVDNIEMGLSSAMISVQVMK